MRKFLPVMLIILSAVVFRPISVNADPPTVLTTTTVLQDIVGNIVGDVTTVETLIQKGVDPHDYQPSAEDSNKLGNADVVFYFGGGVEEVLDNTLQSLSDQGRAMAITEVLPEDLLIPSDEEGKLFNPHVWLDPVLMEVAIYNITNKLVEIDPDNAATYNANRDSYLLELQQLHNATLKEVDKLPEDQKFLVTQHGAFTYWVTRYGFEYRSLEGISTTDEVSLQEIDALAQYLKDNQIKVIYLETTVPDTQAQAVIQAAEGIGWKVAIGGTLYSGSLGDGEASTYTGMMLSNAKIIVNGILNPPADAGAVDTPVFFLPIVFTLPVMAWLVSRKERV